MNNLFKASGSIKITDEMNEFAQRASEYILSRDWDYSGNLDLENDEESNRVMWNGDIVYEEDNINFGKFGIFDLKITIFPRDEEMGFNGLYLSHVKNPESETQDIRGEGRVILFLDQDELEYDPYLISEIKKNILHEIVHIADPKLYRDELATSPWGADNIPMSKGVQDYEAMENYLKEPWELDAHISSISEEKAEEILSYFDEWSDIKRFLHAYSQLIFAEDDEKDDFEKMLSRNESVWKRYITFLYSVLEEKHQKLEDARLQVAKSKKWYKIS